VLSPPCDHSSTFSAHVDDSAIPDKLEGATGNGALGFTKLIFALCLLWFFLFSQPSFFMSIPKWSAHKSTPQHEFSLPGKPRALSSSPQISDTAAAFFVAL